LLESVNEAVALVSREQVRGASWSAETLARAVIDDARSGRASCRQIYELEGVLMSANPTMGSIASLVWTLKEACMWGVPLDVAAEAFIEYVRVSRSEVASHARDLVKDSPITAMTLSYSTNVINVLLSLGPMLKKVYVLESLPGGEGRQAATELRSRRVNVELLPDTAASSVIGLVDAVLIGADNVTLDGCVYNKLGSKNLTILAGYFGKPVVVAFEPYKISPEARCGGVRLLERSYQAEPWGEITYKVFDELTSDLVDAVLSVRGLGDNTQPNLMALRKEFEEWITRRLTGGRSA
jgi:translation initiation factor eIF-2B subunit delta